jgi:hypothetical protein
LLADKPNINLALITEGKKHYLKLEAWDRYLATVFILGTDLIRYGGLIPYIENNYLNGTNKFPRTITAAYNLLVNWKGDPNKQPQGVTSDGVAFTNDGVALAQPARAKKDIANIECYNCGKLGHYSSDCPKPRKQTGEQLLTARIESGEFDGNDCAFVNNGKGLSSDSRSAGVTINGGQGRILNMWILLDNQSTVDVFHNSSLLERIRASNNGHMDIHCNAGVTSTNLMFDLPGYGTVWYHPNGIANILSLNKVKERYRVTYDSTNGNAFVVHKGDGTPRTFQQLPRGLFYMDTATTGTLLVNTVAENKTSYTNCDYLKAVLAREIQKKIGQPSTRASIKIVDNKLLPNCTITREDILAAKHIFVGLLKGKTVHPTPKQVNA